MKNNIKYFASALVLALGASLSSCDKDKETEEVSRVTTFADITLVGGSPFTIVKGTAASYVDPGATAKDESGNPVPVETTRNTVDVNKFGSYIVEYKAVNVDGFVSTNRRVVNVIGTGLRSDISGEYVRTANGRKATVSKEGTGFYLISDVWGSATSGGAPFPQPARLLNYKDDSLLVVPSPTSFGNGVITGKGLILPNGDLSIDTDLGGAAKRVNVWVKQ